MALSITNTTATLNKEIIPLSASTHLPTKLRDSNFTVWKKQLETTLFGYNLLCYIKGELSEPSKTKADKSVNEDYFLWNRQDQFILSAMLGSCSETIQPLISTALYSKEAWERLQKMYANKSRTRVLSLKAKLIQNPRENRSITSYMQEMRAIADSLALADNPVSDEDLFLHIITQLGPQYKDITAALRARDTAISFDDLFDRLRDFENQLSQETKSVVDSLQPIIPTANHTTKTKSPRYENSLTSKYTPPHASQNRTPWRSNPNFQNRSHFTGQSRYSPQNRSSSYCNNIYSN